jgi:hypothetical protein
MSFVFSILKINHHNIKQFHRQELYDVLNLILKNTESSPHCNYLQPYVVNALECFSFHKSIFKNSKVITINNKNKLKHIIYFISNRDCYGRDVLQKLRDMYNMI